MSLPEIDTAFFLFINKTMSNGLFNVVMPALSEYTKRLYLPLVLWAFYRQRRYALFVVITAILAVLLADGTGHVLKDLIARARPCQVMNDINLLVGCGKSFSMPSNHACNVFAASVFFYLLYKDAVSIAYLLVAASVGFSRVYVGVHYPSDVIAGAFLGGLLGFSAFYTLTIASKRFPEVISLSQRSI